MPLPRHRDESGCVQGTDEDDDRRNATLVVMAEGARMEGLASRESARGADRARLRIGIILNGLDDD